MSITIRQIDSESALYSRYSGEASPARVYVYLDPRSEEMWAEPSHGDGVPVTVWNRLVMRWRIPILTGSSAEALMRDLVPHAQAIVDGFEEVWDGSNWKGHLNDLAQRAEAEIDRLCMTCDGSFDQVEEWDAWDFFGDLGPERTADAYKITADSTDDDLEGAADRAETDAAESGIHVLRNARKYFTWLRSNIIEESNDGEESEKE